MLKHIMKSLRSVKAIAICSLVAFVTSIVVVTGCATTQITPDNVGKVSMLVGLATGQVVNMTEMDNETRLEILGVLDTLDGKFVQVDVSVVDDWGALVSDEIEKMIAEGKIDAKYTSIIKSVFLIIGEGLDYMFEKYPAMKQYTNIGISAINGFISGLESGMSATLSVGEYAFDEDDIEVYEDAYKHLNDFKNETEK